MHQILIVFSLSIRESLQISNYAKAEMRHRFGIIPTAGSVDSLNVNLDAGADMIDYYQYRWQQLHELSQENAKKSIQITSALTEIDCDVQRLHSATNKLIDELSSIPDLEQSINAIELEIERSMPLLNLFEDAITELNNQAISMDYEHHIMESEQKISNLVRRREDDIRLLESHYIAKEEQKIREKAEREALLLREKQDIFQKAFEDQLQAYKLGNINDDNDVRSNLNNDENLDKKLAEISLDIAKEEVDALEKFLQDDDNDEKHKD